MAECRKNFRDLLAAHGVLRVELELLASVALANRVDSVRITVAVLANRAGCWAVLVLVRGTWVEARRYSIRSMAPNFHYPPCSATSRHRSKSLRASVSEPGALINLRRLCCWHWWRRQAGQCPVLAGRWVWLRRSPGNLRKGWRKQHKIGIIRLTDDSFDLVHNLPAHNRLKNVHLECKNSPVGDCFFHAQRSLFIKRTAPPYPESLGAWEQSPDAKPHGFLDSCLLPLRRRAHASS